MPWDNRLVHSLTDNSNTYPKIAQIIRPDAVFSNTLAQTSHQTLFQRIPWEAITVKTMELNETLLTEKRGRIMRNKPWRPCLSSAVLRRLHIRHAWLPHTGARPHTWRAAVAAEQLGLRRPEFSVCCIVFIDRVVCNCFVMVDRRLCIAIPCSSWDFADCLSDSIVCYRFTNQLRGKIMNSLIINLWIHH